MIKHGISHQLHFGLMLLLQIFKTCKNIINLLFKNAGACINSYSVIFSEFLTVENGTDPTKHQKM